MEDSWVPELDDDVFGNDNCSLDDTKTVHKANTGTNTVGYVPRNEHPLAFLGNGEPKTKRERDEDQHMKSKGEYLYFTKQYIQCVEVVKQLVDKECHKKVKNRNAVLLKDYYETIVRCLLHLQRFEEALHCILTYARYGWFTMEDVDVLLEISASDFRLYVLKAEILNKLGRYGGLNYLHNQNYIWAFHCLSHCMKLLEQHTSINKMMNTGINVTYNQNKQPDSSNYAFYTEHYSKLHSDVQKHLDTINQLDVTIATSTLPSASTPHEQMIKDLLKSSDDAETVTEEEVDPTKL